MAEMRFGSNEVMSALSEALRREVQRVIDEEAAAAAKRCQERVQREVGQIATGLLSNYRMHLQGRDELHIIVKIEGPESP